MECPCKNCLTLGICKALVRKGDLFDLLSLTDRCDFFKWYIFPHKEPQFAVQQKLTLKVGDKVSYNIHTKGGRSVRLDYCINELKETLLKDVDFTDGWGDLDNVK